MSSSGPALIDQISAAMSVSSLRNQVIANNIANRDTPGYQRLQVGFAQAFEAMAGDVVDGTTGAPFHLASSRQAVVSAESSTSPRSLEDDMVAMSSNTLGFEALARGLSMYFSIVSTVTNGSKG